MTVALPTAEGPPCVRAFVATAINPELREVLVYLQKRLRRCPCRVGWVAPQNLHITLAFLGDVPRQQLPAMSLALDTVARTCAPFSYNAVGLGFFGSPRSPKVLWCGVGTGAEPLIPLQAGLRQALAPFGYREDKACHPHITLGRVRASRNADQLVEAMKKFTEAPFATVPVTEITLMQSLLLPEGPRYVELHASPLGSRG